MENYLTYKEYIGTVDFCSEDEVFFGKIQGIQNLVTFEGESVQELKKAFSEAVEDYLETCAELGKAPNKTYKGSFNVRITEDLHRQVAFLAAKHSITLNELVKKAIIYTVSHEKDIEDML